MEQMEQSKSEYLDRYLLVLSVPHKEKDFSEEESTCPVCGTSKFFHADECSLYKELTE